ncbi:MAG: hypothetical protein R3291_05095 [Thermoplasmata archaeon]|nr:hypothetical protein [Thermoplasmata archaeon]
MIEREIAQEILNALPGQVEEPRLLLVGVGGAGINMLRAMGSQEGFRRVAIDTDDYALALSQVPRQIHLRTDLPRGTGGDPDIGQAAARRQGEDLRRTLEGDSVIILAGLGRGTGTGVAPEVARMAKEAGIPVFALLAWPFQDEGLAATAQNGLGVLETSCDGLVVLDNESAIALPGIEGKRDAALMVNAMMGGMLLDLYDRVQEALPFSLQEELADFMESVGEAGSELPVRAAYGRGPRRDPRPLPLDAEGVVQFR